MKNPTTKLVPLASLVLASLLAGPVFAGPMEDADAAFKAKKYAEVDEALKPLLDQPAPPADALELSFRAAYADFRPYTAISRMRALMDMKASPSAETLYQAGECAYWTGNGEQATDYYTYFLKLDDRATPRTRKALRRVCGAGGAPEFFRRYVAQFKADENALHIGLNQIDKLLQQGKSSDVIELFGSMLAIWPKGSEEVRILHKMRDAAGANVFGVTPQTLSRAFTMATDADLETQMARNFFEDNLRGDGRVLFNLQNNRKDLLPKYLWRMLCEMRVPEGDEIQLASGMASLAPLVLKTDDPDNIICYLNMLGRKRSMNEPTFAPKGKDPLVSQDMLAKLLQRYAELHPTAPSQDERDSIWTIVEPFNFGGKIVAIGKKRPDMISQRIEDTMVQSFRDHRDPEGLKAMFQAALNRTAIWGWGPHILEVADSYGDKDLYKRILTAKALRYPRSLDENTSLMNLFGSAKCMTVDEKADMLREILTQGGAAYSNWERFFNAVDSDQNCHLHKSKSPKMESLLADYRAGKFAGDATTGKDRDLCLQRSNVSWENRVEAFKRFTASPRIKGKTVNMFQKGPDGAPTMRRTMESGWLASVVDTTISGVGGDRNHYEEMLNLVLPFLDADYNFDRLKWHCWDNGGDFRGKLAAMVAARIRQLDTPEKKLKMPSWIISASVTDKNASPLAGHYADFSMDQNLSFWERGKNTWDPAFAAAELNKILTCKPGCLREITSYRRSDLSAWLQNFSKAHPEAFKNFDFEPLAKLYFDDVYRERDWICRIMRVYEYAGKINEGMDRFISVADKLPAGAATRILAIAFDLDRDERKGSYLARFEGQLDEAGHLKRSHNDTFEMIDRFLKIAATAKDPAEVCIPGSVGWSISWFYENMWNKDRFKITDEEREMVKQKRKAFCEPWVKGGWVGWGSLAEMSLSVPCNEYLIPAIDNGTVDSTLPLAVVAMIRANIEYRPQYYEKAAQKLLDGGYEELAYLICARAPKAEGNATLARIRTAASAKMPGLYPVGEKDPAYPLYVAADMLARNNTERAWSLLSANAREFDKDPLRYSPQFTVWALDQYRKARGKNDELRDKAWSHIDRIMEKESTLTPEFAADLLLVRAEIARDRMTYDVAHQNYQTIRNHPTYQKTPAGRTAMFRDVDLLITMGQNEAAEQTAEQWLTMPDNDIRAQAYYVLARLAFDRKDYDETRKQFEKVFELDFTHTEARLLQGQWKLATNYEVDDTQVLIGGLADRSMLRPGQPLSISVQDRNLSVAGGGASIPILVTTSVGGDQEKLDLYPTTREPSLFRGALDTCLGKAEHGNHKLELAGNDTVSYQIDPEFLVSRGLPPTDPKRLMIVDDATMAIGAVALKASEMDALDELDGALSGNVVDEYATKLASKLRPGSPLHIALKDADRSLAGKAADVTVSILTTSGDAIPNCKLVETEPCSGIFRAKVVTACPPPRVAVSDAATGNNPGDIISTVRDGKWESMQDGAKGKWVEVDTMGSHEVSEASIEMDSPKSVQRLYLYGSLMDDERILATYPEEPVALRSGIRLQSYACRTRDRSDTVREFIKSKVMIEKARDWAIQLFHDRGEDRRHILRARIFVPETTVVRMRPEPTVLDQKGYTPLWNLEYTVLCDGHTLYFDRGADCAKRFHDVEIEAGCHEFEIFVKTSNRGDSFRMVCEQDDGSLAPLPSSWSDPTQNPQLENYLKDCATIKLDSKGYVASFFEPTRLRKLRWEFVDFAGAGIKASKFTVKETVNENEEKIVVPSEHDFSEALGNDILEVAPGDTITVTYQDEVTTTGQRRAVEKTLDSSFHDAEVEFLYEDIVTDWSGHRSIYRKAYRIVPGDTIYVRVKDPDANLSDGQDSVKVKLENSAGKQFAVTAKERTSIDRDGTEIVRTSDQGVFIGRIKTYDPSKGEGKGVPLSVGDSFVARYLDQENTKPGIPVEREVTIASVVPSEPELRLYDTWSERVPDTDALAQLKLAQIRRRSESMAATNVWRILPVGELSEPTAVARVTPGFPLVIEAVDAASARHENSTIEAQIATQRELDDAEAEGRDPEWRTIKMPIARGRSVGKGRNALRLRTKKTDAPALVSTADATRLPDTFLGSIDLPGRDGEKEIEVETPTFLPPGAQPEEEIPPLDAHPGDTIIVRVQGRDGSVSERRAELVTSAWIGLVDGTLAAENDLVHLGEAFHVLVDDPDQDTTEDLDTVEVTVKAKSGVEKEITLRETMPHSGVFSASLTPDIFTDPNEATNLTDRVASAYGDVLTFSYKDEVAAADNKPGVRKTTGTVRKGADGDVRAYSKRFTDSDQAVLVQFRLAECLFEMAKDYRKLKQDAKSTAAIASGREILEAALRDYPDTSHAAEGEFLLANLYQELAEEKMAALKKSEDDAEKEQLKEEARPLYLEAVARFSAILAAWPEAELAARAQYHKAFCLERVGDFAQAAEEYVKMTYLFPESPLVGDASVRLAGYYYSQEKRYDIAGHIYANFQNRFPTHAQAANSLFMSGQCFVKQAEALTESKKNQGGRVDECYKNAVASFSGLIDKYRDIDNKELLAQAMYWAGDASFRRKDYPNAFLYLKRTTFEYPESKWARYARGMLLQEEKAFSDLQ